MEQIFGLPAHPFFVHAPIVLMPLTTLLAILFMFSAKLRRRYASLMLGSSVVLFAVTFLAGQSGEAFQEAMGSNGSIVNRHAELADQTRLLTLALTVISVVMFFRLRKLRRLNDLDENNSVATDPVELGITIGLLVVALLGTLWMIRTGHEGAKVVWDGTIKKR